MSEATDWQAWGIPIIVIAVILIILLVVFLIRRHVRGPMYKGEAVSMEGKTVVITGANTGIGKETALDLAKRGAKVIIACRDVTKGSSAAEDIKNDTGKEVAVVKCDLSSLESVRNCAAEINEMEDKIHVLINNAGIMMCPQWQTKDGYELQFGTNHLGHFLLTNLLLNKIKVAAPSRIVNVSSLVHKWPQTEIHWNDVNMKDNYDPRTAYQQSKLANVLFTKSLAKKLKDDGVTAYCLHPGTINSELGRHLGESYGSLFDICLTPFKKFFFKTPVLGAQTTIYCAVDEKLGEESGYYYSDCKRSRESQKGKIEADADRLWKLSMEMVGLEETTQIEDLSEKEMKIENEKET